MANFFDNKARAANAASSSSSKPKQSSATAERAQPWVEKYRPKDLSEVKAQDHVVDVLRRMLNYGNLPHLLLYGPPGNGKTSTIIALCRELYGPLLYNSRVLTLNASDDRGISIIRTKVKDFSRLQLSNAPISEEYRKLYPCPPFRICVLDEADALSQDAQAALRRVMEIHSTTTRCSKFRFKTLAGVDASARLAEIAVKEDVKYEDGVIQRLLEVSEGDMRRAVTYLQSSFNLTSAGATASAKGKRGKKLVQSDDSDEEMTDAPSRTAPVIVTIRTVEEVAGVIATSVIQDLVSAMQPSKRGAIYETVSKQITAMVADGWSANQVLSQLYTLLIADETLDSRKKLKIFAIFSEVDKSLVDGSDEHLTALDLALRVASVLGEMK
ncbi:hypothetical protein EPUS_02144 [Endocarpon pusillum Z07020]|uniref:AAA+ ATPase domain-containing protein n=1 Tax=Endocarpon pusillum (strain Z07020 / HMAS-L-300199) TaxID=1263415 RepID=U1G4L7_ENDPU|nr:uncharacterized protein EPUS_02144 [Endocarpon pusillum Z07020]ERF72257.1 hypothetical protein EPUS_02144 [Endocarpon pusillum Z07020]